MKKQYLEITDLPTDQFNALHKLRPILVSVYNNSRTTPYKLKLFKQTLKFVYNMCTAYEEFLLKNESTEGESKPVAKESTTTESSVESKTSDVKPKADQSVKPVVKVAKT